MPGFETNLFTSRSSLAGFLLSIIILLHPAPPVRRFHEWTNHDQTGQKTPLAGRSVLPASATGLLSGCASDDPDAIDTKPARF